jgi:hypothetical protein
MKINAASGGCCTIGNGFDLPLPLIALFSVACFWYRSRQKEV